MRIALFATCIVDAMYPRTAQATVGILERLGHEVVFPSGQACCGQMHVNSGYLKEAVPVVANHVRAFDTADYDVANLIVTEFVFAQTGSSPHKVYGRQ